MILILKQAKVIVDTYDGLVPFRNLTISEISVVQELMKQFDYFREGDYPILEEHMGRVEREWKLQHNLTTEKELNASEQ